MGNACVLVLKGDHRSKVTWYGEPRQRVVPCPLLDAPPEWPHAAVMQLLVTRSKWDVESASLEEFLRRVKADGFDGTEIFLPGLRETPQQSIELHQKYDLKLVGQIVTAGATPAEHLRSLEERFSRALQFQPIMINCHSG